MLFSADNLFFPSAALLRTFPMMYEKKT